MHPCISIRGFVCPSVVRLVGPSIRLSYKCHFWPEQREFIKKGATQETIRQFEQIWASLSRSWQVWANMGKLKFVGLSVLIHRFIHSVIHRFIHRSINRLKLMFTYEKQWMHRCLPVKLVYGTKALFFWETGYEMNDFEKTM